RATCSLARQTGFAVLEPCRFELGLFAPIDIQERRRSEYYALLGNQHQPSAKDPDSALLAHPASLVESVEELYWRLNLDEGSVTGPGHAAATGWHPCPNLGSGNYAASPAKPSGVGALHCGVARVQHCSTQTECTVWIHDTHGTLGRASG